VDDWQTVFNIRILLVPPPADKGFTMGVQDYAPHLRSPIASGKYIMDKLSNPGIM
jgi:hypothetical protein